jgi:erythronate-4-phosphate dehydrogenase
MMKIIADQSIPLVCEVFSHLGDIVTVPGREITSEVVRDAGILLVRSVTRVDRGLLDDSSVKFVATATTGIDHVDTEYLKSRGIGFGYAPGSNARSVAEYTFAALVYCSRKCSFNLREKVVGIVGVGNIGKRVLSRARILGTECLCNDPPRARREGPEQFVSLDELLSRADVVTIHVPLIHRGIDATLRMVDKAFLSRMKTGAFLVNTSRGKVVDEEVLKKASARLGGLVLDVWDNEPAIDTGLLAMTECATPHIAGYSYDGKANGTGMIYRAACDFLGARPRWEPSDHLDKVPVREIGLSPACSDPVGDSIMQAYPIGRDDAALRQIAEVPREEQPAYFDLLRSNYAMRLEFSHFRVDTAPCNGIESIGSVREELTGLGFLVK